VNEALMASHEGIDRKCAVSAQIAPLVRLMETSVIYTTLYFLKSQYRRAVLAYFFIIYGEYM
jgi:hypothetical protein